MSDRQILTREQEILQGGVLLPAYPQDRIYGAIYARFTERVADWLWASRFAHTSNRMQFVGDNMFVMDESDGGDWALLASIDRARGYVEVFPVKNDRHIPFMEWIAAHPDVMMPSGETPRYPQVIARYRVTQWFSSVLGVAENYYTSNEYLDAATLEAINESADDHGSGRSGHEVAEAILAARHKLNDDGTWGREFGLSGASVLYASYDADKRTMSYLPSNRIDGEAEPWSSRKRVSSPITRLFRAWLHEELVAMLDDHDFQQFTTFLQGTGIDTSEIRLVNGPDISYWYNENHYSRSQDTGSLASSCMRYSNLGKRLSMYDQNPNQISMSILVDGDNRLLARAIVWTLPDGTRLQDRIYGNESGQQALRKWAKDNDIKSIYPRGGDGAVVHLENPWHGSYPWTDTMVYLTSEGHLRPSANDSNGRRELQDGFFAHIHGLDLRGGWPLCQRCKTEPLHLNTRSSYGQRLCQSCRAEVAKKNGADEFPITRLLDGSMDTANARFNFMENTVTIGEDLYDIIPERNVIRMRGL